MTAVRAAALALCLGAAAGAAAAQTTIITIQPSPTPPQHAPRPTLSEAERADLQRPPLVSAGAPVAASGEIAAGQAFLTVPVRHGFTGVLAKPVTTERGFNHPSLPAGQAVYGQPMGGPDGPGLVWCAPRSAGQPVRWTAVCLPYGDESHVWVEGEPALLASQLKWHDASARTASAPEVDRRPIDLPPMRLDYAFAGVDPRGWAIVAIRLDWGEGPKLLRSVALPPAADGATHLRLMGGEIALRRVPGSRGAAERARVELLAPLIADAALTL